MAINIYPDGTIVHYSEPRKVSEVSKKNLTDSRNKAKTFTLKPKHKRLIRGAVVSMWNAKAEKQYCNFATVTFSNDVPNDEKIRQKIFKQFIKNAVQNYDFKGYVSVKERGETGDLLHYHILFIAPFVRYSSLNRALCSAHINNGYTGSKNCFTTSSKNKGHTVKSYDGVIRYITKYMKKGSGVFETKCYFIGGTAKFIVKKVVSDEQTNFLFDNFPVQWRYVGDNFAITKHQKDAYNAV